MTGLERADPRRLRTIVAATMLAALAAAPAACGGNASGGDADAGTPDIPQDAIGDAERDGPDASEDGGAPDGDAARDDTEGGPEGEAGSGEDGEDGEDDEDGEDADASEDGDAAPRVVSCADDPPAGADLPDPLPVYAGACPVLAPGPNTITSSGSPRSFVLVVPAALDPAERLPVIFLWHWLGGEAADFLTQGDVQAGADAARFLAAIPEAKGDLLFKWPYMLIDSNARVEEEARFFDDMLACIAGQYEVDGSCVSTVGVSAGGLWTPQLAQRRPRRLASFVALSGGVGRDGDWLNPVRPWLGAEHRMPAIVLWGGPTDFCGMSFATTSAYLEEALAAAGHFLVECVHNCSHAEPPMSPPPGESKYSALWDFALDHPFWLEDGESPYLVTGIPPNFPAWCGIGPGGATPRAGTCEGGILGDCL